MIHKVSFDYDGCLSGLLVQLFATYLVKRDDVEVWVTTTRYSSDAPPKYMKNGVWVEHNNDDLFKDTDAIGIPRDRIVFTNGADKWNHIKDQGFTWHLDDDWHEIQTIDANTKCFGITNFGNPKWATMCKNLINYGSINNKRN